MNNNMIIINFCKTYNFGHVISITKLFGGLMHKMFKVETDKDTYCFKILNPEVMSRSEAYNNFVRSETISNFVKENGIFASNALKIDGKYLTKYNDFYFMIFKFIDGKILKDEEITIDHCRKIGYILAHIHSLDFNKLGINPPLLQNNKIIDWEKYTKNSNYDKMSYKEIYLKNYKKYDSLYLEAYKKLIISNKNLAICHLDMDPKNVMWENNNPIIIDWECAGISNPDREIFEDALCWSGFLSNNFNHEKFLVIFKEYSKYRKIDDIDWYNVAFGNLIGRLEWLKYNLERSLGIISNDRDEKKKKKNEVIKTIDELNRYLELIDELINIIISIICEKNKKMN